MSLKPPEARQPQPITPPHIRPQKKGISPPEENFGTPRNLRAPASHGKAPQRAAKKQTVRHRRSDAPGAISPPEIGSGGAHRVYRLNQIQPTTSPASRASSTFIN